MNAHTPFDAKKDWSNPYCQNSSNDPMVDALLGNAYHVVRTVYCNLGNLKLIYDFLNQYGLVLGVQSEAELKALTTKAKYARIYGFSRAGDRQVTDYLYVEGDRTGIIPDDPKATGSWITVATSGSNGGGASSGEGAYIPWVYSNGSATGGETTINVPDGTVGVPFIIVNGDMQYVGRGFEFNVDSLSVTLAQPLEEGDEVVFLLTGVPAVPDNPNVNDWVQINWLYNNGAAVGGEQVIAVPYTFQSVPAVYKNGLRLYKGLTTESYTADPDNQRILLTEPLATNDRLIVQIGGEAQVLEASDHTLQEVARAANVKDSEVILSTDTTQVLNGKKIIYDVVAQRIYGLPTLPTNVYINSVSNGQLTYSPGNITVTLLDSYQQYIGDGSQLSVLAAGSDTPRTLADRFADVINVKDFGAVGDGVTDDTQAIQNALDSGKNIYIPEGVYICTEELEITTHGQRIFGASKGYGYTALNTYYSDGQEVPHYTNPVFNWVDSSTLMFIGTGTKRLRTRRVYRSSANDPNDAPLSVSINIQAEGVRLEQFAVRTKVQEPSGGAAGEATDSVNNLGADWDVGVFVGCRCNTQLIDLAVIGYHRKANIWFDVTQPLGAGRFRSYRTGKEYPRGLWGDGSDGCTLERVFTSGGLWGVNVFGASPAPGQDSYAPSGFENYFDPIDNVAIRDSRGGGGFSDFMIMNSQIFGANHHTKCRFVDMKPDPNPLTDWDVGGAFNIDGLGASSNKAVHGHRYVGTRFQSDAPFCVRIDRSARDTFLGCMIENPYKVKTHAGVPIEKHEISNTFYGLCATANHRYLHIIESQAPYFTTYTKMKYGDTIVANNDARESSKMPFCDLRLLSEDTSSDKQPVIFLGTIDDPGFARITRAKFGTVQVRTDAAFQFMRTSDSTMQFSVNADGDATITRDLFPAMDATSKCGRSSNRWSVVYAASPTINTSDERCKIVSEFDGRLMSAWSKVGFVPYKFKDAVVKKGEDARIHVGLIAQRIKEAFESEGLNAFEYGLLCWDKWDDEFDEEGNKITSAGELYGVRYEEALALEAVYLRSEINKLKEVISLMKDHSTPSA